MVTLQADNASDPNLSNRLPSKMELFTHHHQLSVNTLRSSVNVDEPIKRLNSAEQADLSRQREAMKSLISEKFSIVVEFAVSRYDSLLLLGVAKITTLTETRTIF